MTVATIRRGEKADRSRRLSILHSYVNAEIHSALKIAAIERGMTMMDLLHEFLCNCLDREDLLSLSPSTLDKRMM